MILIFQIGRTEQFFCQFKKKPFHKEEVSILLFEFNNYVVIGVDLIQAEPGPLEN